MRLAQVADVRLGAENERSAARANTIPAVSLAIEQLSTANTVEVSRGVRAEMPSASGPGLPAGMRIELNYDRAEFIEASMNEVVKALGVAIVLVLVVIYVFLGNLRATAVPAVVVPVSVVATFIVMSALGYTVNTLTLLGLVLAIGLVVDDAIVVLENIYRRIERGQAPLLAALEGSREIGFAVVATTLVLVAVFVPISFIQGDVGRLFAEFGITLAAAVCFSSLVALTLTPMMCSTLFRGRTERTGLARVIDRFFQRLTARYERIVRRVARHPGTTVAGSLILTVLAVVLVKALPSEYAPKEDRGVFFITMRGPEGASLEYTDRHAQEMERILMKEVDDGDALRILLRLPASFGSTGEVNSARAIIILKSWGERSDDAETVAARLRAELAGIPGARTAVITPQSLGIRGDGRPVELVLGGPDYDQLREWRDIVLGLVDEMPELVNGDSNYQERKPQMRVEVDRDRAAALGVSLSEVGRTLETMLGSRIVTTYVDRGTVTVGAKQPQAQAAALSDADADLQARLENLRRE